MIGQWSATQRIRAVIWVFVSVTGLTGCGGGDSGATQGGGISAPGNAVIYSSPDVPENLVSYEDSSVIVDAVNRGLDPEFDLLRTRFNCYVFVDSNNLPETDFSTPHMTVDIIGNNFGIGGLFGTVSGSVQDSPNSDSFTLLSDSGDAERFGIRFDLFGQSFHSISNDLISGCYQSGAAHERALHQFQLNTPEVGDYSCIVGQNSTIYAEDVPFRLLGRNRYIYNGSTGDYSYEGVFEGNSSTILFNSGVLAGELGQYSENPNSGRQQLSLVMQRSASAAICERQRPPRPFKRYGTTVISSPDASSVPLTGVYYYEDGNPASVGWLAMSADGFFSTELPLPGGTNCRRSLPNGLAPCHKYIYNGGSTLTLIGPNEQVNLSFMRGANGSMNIGALGLYIPVRSPSTAELVGQWRIDSAQTQDNVDISMCILGYCSPTGVSSLIFEFFEDGRFVFESSSQSTSSVSVPSVNVFTSAFSQDYQSGTYQLNGPLLQLEYFSGEADPDTYLHLIDANTLVIGYRVFRRV